LAIIPKPNFTSCSNVIAWHLFFRAISMRTTWPTRRWVRLPGSP